MALSLTQAKKLADLAERAKNWRATRKVPPNDREDIVQVAVAEVWASETHDESLGSLEPFFRKIIDRRVARYFADPTRRQQPRMAPSAEALEMAEVAEWLGITEGGAKTDSSRTISAPSMRRYSRMSGALST